jgi:hypothetical protein
VIVKTAKINFKTFPVDLSQFAILNIESEKKKSPVEGAPEMARLLFLGRNRTKNL